MLKKHKKNLWLQTKFDEYVIFLVYKYRKKIAFYEFLKKKNLLSCKQKVILFLKSMF